MDPCQQTEWIPGPHIMTISKRMMEAHQAEEKMLGHSGITWFERTTRQILAVLHSNSGQSMIYNNT